MKTFSRAAPAAGMFLSFSLFLVPARLDAQGPAVPAGTNIALLDMNRVFENHLRFKAAMDDLKNDIKNYESSLAQQQNTAAQMNERLGTFKPGSPEYKELEAQLAQMAANLQVNMAIQKKEFLNREAKVYYQAYMEVVEQVTDFALRNNIALVLSYSGDVIDPTNRGSVLQGVNRAVVYQQNLDITSQILDRLNRGAAPTNIGARPLIPQRR